MLASASREGGLPGLGGGSLVLWSWGRVCLVWGVGLWSRGGLPGPGWGDGSLVPGGLPGPGGGLWSWGVCLVRGVCLVWGGCLPGPGGLASQHALRQTIPPLWTESETPVKTLPWPNFVAAGKNRCITKKTGTHNLQSSPKPETRTIANFGLTVEWITYPFSESIMP